MEDIVYRFKATLESEDGKTWRVKKVDYLAEKRPGWQGSEFVDHGHCIEWEFELRE